MERIAIIEGLRTPFGKAGGVLKTIAADDLGAIVVKEALQRTSLTPDQIDEVIIGNVAQPSNAANIARVVALKAGLPQHIPAFTVHRNCASGLQSITTASDQILTGKSSIIIAGGTESMTNIPLLFNDHMKAFFEKLMRAKTLGAKLSVLSSFRPKFLKPRVGLLEGLTDPVCGLIMGLTAENLSKEFHITREAQDKYALESHQKAAKAKDLLAEEIIPVPVGPQYNTTISTDEAIRGDQTIEALAKLRPYFDRKNGTVTVGNSCPINDGAAAVILMSESKAKELGLTPIGYIRDYAYAGLEPSRMGLGPIYSTAKALDQAGMTMKDIDLVEINEAFAAQVLANLAAFDSDQFSKKFLGKDKKLGTIDPKTLNVNGGAIAIGHPVGTSGTRIVLTLLKELKRRKKNCGLATLCIGGGQGGAAIVEVA